MSNLERCSATDELPETSRSALQSLRQSYVIEVIRMTP